MDIERKFMAAVNVIRNLPSNGPFQPTVDMQLKFYALFKQATLGPCTIARPSFWDIQGLAKWKSWKSLREMPKEEAMETYINELYAIVETMSYNANVESFLNSFQPIREGSASEDVDIFLRPLIEKNAEFRNQVNAVTAKSEYEPNLIVSARSHKSHSESSLEAMTINEESSEEELFADTEEGPTLDAERQRERSSLKGHFQLVVDQMKKDIDELNQRVSNLELAKTKPDEKQSSRKPEKQSQFFPGWTEATIAFVIIWPVVVSSVISYAKRKN